MKKILYIFAILIVLMMVSCASYSIELQSVEKDGNEIDIDRGEQYQSNSTKNLSILMKADDIENHEGMISVGLMNKNKVSYIFDDSQVAIYGGNIDSDQWELVHNWDALSYFSKEEREARNAEFWNAFAGALSVASASMGSYSSSTVNTRYGSATINTRTYNPADVALTSMVADSNARSLKTANTNYLSTLQDVLLFDSRIAPSDVYSGLIFFEVDDKYPDYKIELKDGNETRNFYFSRADREEIINPWMDQSHPLHSISYSIPLNGRNAVQYNYLNHSGIGGYFGVSWYNNQSLNGYLKNGENFKYWEYFSIDDNFSFYFDPDPTDYESSVYLYDGRFTPKVININDIAGGFGGINYKIAPHFWVSLGAEISLTSSVYSGSLEYKSYRSDTWKMYDEDFKFIIEYTDPDLLPQIGLHFAANFIDISAYVSHSVFFNKTFFNLGCGFVFS